MSFVTSVELAAELKVTTRTIRRYIASGEIPSSALTGRHRGLRIHREKALDGLRGRKRIQDSQGDLDNTREDNTREGPARVRERKQSSRVEPTPRSIPAEKTNQDQPNPIQASLLDALRRAHAAGCTLRWLTLTAPPACSAEAFERALETFTAAFACWGILGANRPGEALHVHVLVATEDGGCLEDAVFDWCVTVGASERAQDQRSVTGWQRFVDTGDDTLLQPNIWRIVAYLGRHDVRRVIRTGLFAKTEKRSTIVRVERFPESLSVQLGSEPPARPARHLPVGSPRRVPRSDETRSGGQPKPRNRAPERNGHMLDPPLLALDVSFLDAGAAYAPPLATTEQAARERAPIPGSHTPQSSSEPEQPAADPSEAA
jgi:hypothetical protein